MATVELLKIGDTSIQLAEQFVNFGIGALIAYGMFFLIVFSLVLLVFFKVFRNMDNMKSDMNTHFKSFRR